jgi:hypothetical protein
MRKPRLSRLALAVPLAAILLSGCIIVPRDGYRGHHGRGGYYQQNAQEAAQVQPAPRGRWDGR